MKDLKRKIMLSQRCDDDATLFMIRMFEPLINKYTKRMRFDEDFRSEMVLHLIIMLRTMDLNRMNCANDYAIIKYISTSLYHRYIYLSSRSARYDMTDSYDDEALDSWLQPDYTFESTINDIFTDNAIGSLLSEREYICIKLTILDGLTSSEAASRLGITRQSANESKLRALKKIHTALYSEFKTG